MTRLFLSLLFPLFTLAPLQPLHVWVIPGQSNAIGQNTAPAWQWTSDNVLMWREGKWLRAIEPIHTHPLAGYGPGLAFAHEMQRRNGWRYRVGIVNCAVGGSVIASWQKGQPNYDNCVYQVRQALGDSGVFSGVLMLQGESDTMTIGQVLAWRRDVIRFAYDFRSDCGNRAAPFIYAQLGYDPLSLTFPYWQNLYNIQPLLQSANRRMIVTDDLVKWDGLHFDAASQEIIGQRLAAAASR